MKTQEEVTWRRFTVHKYHRMAEVGILHEDDQVELIEEDIVERKPIGNRNAMCAIRLNRLLVSLLGDETFVSPQNPVRLSEHLGPQPDLAVIRNRDYRESLPRPVDTLFLIGASGPTLCSARANAKLLLYVWTRWGRCSSRRRCLTGVTSRDRSWGCRISGRSYDSMRASWPRQP